MIEKPEFKNPIPPEKPESKKTSIFEKLFKTKSEERERRLRFKKEKPEPEEKPVSRFEKTPWVKTKDLERLFKRPPDSQLKKDFWTRYRKQPGEIWDSISEKFPELKKPYISKKDFEKVKKEVLKREKWAKDWKEKKEMKSYLEILEKIEKE
jgi:hypothetical protein